jgi:transposase
VLKVQIRHREKVSIAGALVLDPQDQHIRLYHWAYVNETVSTARSARQLQDLRDRLARPMIVVWDRGTIHRGDPIRTLLAQNPDVAIEPLPPYAPDLNPVEQVWGYEKYGRLANFVPETVQQLEQVIQRDFQEIENNPSLLKNLWKGASLPMGDI